MKTPRLRSVSHLLLTTLLLAATTLRFGHHISQGSFLLCYGLALAFGIIVRCLPRKLVVEK